MRRIESENLLAIKGGTLTEKEQKELNRDCYIIGVVTVLAWPLSVWVPYTRAWDICLEN